MVIYNRVQEEVKQVLKVIKNVSSKAKPEKSLTGIIRKFRSENALTIWF